MTNLMHGAIHHSKVKVGDVKKFVSPVWTKAAQDPTVFAGWFMPTNVTIVEGSNRVTIENNLDYDGRAQVEATFIDLGIVDFEITLGNVVTSLRIEVVA